MGALLNNLKKLFYIVNVMITLSIVHCLTTIKILIILVILYIYIYNNYFVEKSNYHFKRCKYTRVLLVSHTSFDVITKESSTILCKYYLRSQTPDDL